MQVLKFGGTSVGSPERMHHVANLIQGGGRVMVVLSAVSGTTNKLLALADALQTDQKGQAEEKLQLFHNEYRTFIEKLFVEDSSFLDQAQQIINEQLGIIQNLISMAFAPAHTKVILAQGELLSTRLFHLYLKSLKIDAVLLSALDFMRINANNEPDQVFIRERLQLLLNAYQQNTIFITQGYICRNINGSIDNLQRGGSDYTATLIGAALQAEEIQIWTDIDGIHNNDPRIVSHTSPVRQVSYREAAELAYFGAKILHPTCVIPAELSKVPIRLKNTFAPSAAGTLISEKGSGKKLTAIAAKNKITALRIRSGRMLNAYGFLRKVFEVFEKYKTPIDMITTSEVSVSLTIDQDLYLNEILDELRVFGEVSIDENQSIICIVGDALSNHSAFTKVIFQALADIPIRMVSYGGSNNNISLLVPSEFKNTALQNLHEHLFNKNVEHQVLNQV